MITDALAAYIRANTSFNVYVNNAPLNSHPCVVIGDQGDIREYQWGASGAVDTGLKTHSYEISVWADIGGGGPRWAAQSAQTVLNLLENYVGILTDNAASPEVLHRVCLIECNDNGAEFDNNAELWAHSIFVDVIHA